MNELERLIACIEDGHQIAAIETEEDLRRFFETSQTKISEVMEGGFETLMAQAKGPEPIEDLRRYLLWEYIAPNVAQLYDGYRFTKDMLEEKLDKSR